MMVRHGEYGWVNNVFVTESLDSGRLVRITVRTNKIPESLEISLLVSSHGQKGIIGRIVEERDMPFTADGTIPDLIINPRPRIPSRMTVAHVLEMIGGKVGSLEAKNRWNGIYRGEGGFSEGGAPEKWLQSHWQRI